jgi:hypothetical protein
MNKYENLIRESREVDPFAPDAWHEREAELRYERIRQVRNYQINPLRWKFPTE